MLTTCEMSPTLWMRADFTNWKKSTTPSVFSRSNWAWILMNVPVRPIPSLGQVSQRIYHHLWIASSDLLAHDSYWPVAWPHLHLVDIIHQLNERGSDGRSFMLRPHHEVKLSHSEGCLHSSHTAVWGFLFVDFKLPQIVDSIRLFLEELDCYLSIFNVQSFAGGPVTTTHILRKHALGWINLKSYDRQLWFRCLQIAMVYLSY